jgi:predicted phage baseplate assembly protein
LFTGSGADDPAEWECRRDLLDSGPADRHFVAEVDDAGTAVLRCGDGRHGQAPPSGVLATVRYRIGNGAAGNIGAGAIRHVVIAPGAIAAVTNPLAARGGVDPESIESVRTRAPRAFRTQRRAVTERDYSNFAEALPDVQRAATTFRWTGSWHTAFVTVDRSGGAAVDEPVERAVRRQLEPYRMAGYDLEVDSPRAVPLEIAMHVCVRSGYFRTDVRAALLDVFSSRVLPDGRRGVFHPDNFTFGQPVYLSPLYAAAQQVAGVASVHITLFQRAGVPDPQWLADGRLPLGRLEIATLDNDPTFPDRGVFRLTLGGGK